MFRKSHRGRGADTQNTVERTPLPTQPESVPRGEQASTLSFVPASHYAATASHASVILPAQSASSQLAAISPNCEPEPWPLEKLQFLTDIGNFYNAGAKSHSDTEYTLFTTIHQFDGLRNFNVGLMDGPTIAATLGNVAAELLSTRAGDIVEQLSDSFSIIARPFHAGKQANLQDVTQTSCSVSLDKLGLDKVTIYFKPELTYDQMIKLKKATSGSEVFGLTC